MNNIQVIDDSSASNDQSSSQELYTRNVSDIRRRINEIRERLRNRMRAFRDEVRRREQQSDNPSSNILDDMDLGDSRAGDANDHNNHSQRFREVYRIVTLKECKIEDWVVCLGSLDSPGKKIVSLKCDIRHAFHQECIDEWLKRKSAWPTCRKRVNKNRRYNSLDSFIESSDPFESSEPSEPSESLEPLDLFEPSESSELSEIY